MAGDEHHGRRAPHAGVVVGALGVAAVAALVALVVPHLTSDDPQPVPPSPAAPSSCLTPTPSGADADWTICWDD
ncbi:hypothetical protein [Nocardioides mangrovi]|uniref:Uncharacterized protein n=1 Tax=Nocardioides mangrovi TaxID=2874580 RepID=A0ABS7U9E0_9ACTN|nr:hypothetical protein [Nocardioides mangrovi]MBZ5737277.1 hypothetical protein [Nocardioides mangrovi]